MTRQENRRVICFRKLRLELHDQADWRIALPRQDSLTISTLCPKNHCIPPRI